MKLPYANKDLGQHFLRDQKVIDRITGDFSGRADLIVEVGPGPAVLSTHLAGQGIPYFAIEKDRRFQEYLEKLTASENIFFEDALQFNWQQFFDQRQIQQKKIWLVSNLPYNISAPLLTSFIPQWPIHFMTLMFQKEVAEKSLMPSHQKNATNSLGVLGHVYFHITKLCSVAPGCFSPPPKVDSMVLSYQRRSDPLIPLSEYTVFEKFLRSLFSQRRKQLGGILKKELGCHNVDTLLPSLGISAKERTENLTLENVTALYRGLNPAP